MRHAITLEGAAFRLRPLTLEDAGFVVGLRTDPRLGRFINPTSGAIADQLAWTEAYFGRADDCYFVVERRRDGRPEGAVAIYEIDAAARAAEWGRWILRPDSLAALESVCLMCDAAFGPLGLERVYSRTVADNHRVVAFHDDFGATRRRLLTGYVTIRGHLHDSVEHDLTAADWPRLAPALRAKAARLARLLGR